MRPLQDSRYLLAHALERAANRGLRRARGLQLCDQLAGLPYVRVDSQPVVSPQSQREIDIGDLRHRVIRQRGERRSDLLQESVLGSS